MRRNCLLKVLLVLLGLPAIGILLLFLVLGNPNSYDGSWHWIPKEELPTHKDLYFTDQRRVNLEEFARDLLQIDGLRAALITGRSRIEFEGSLPKEKKVQIENRLRSHHFRRVDIYHQHQVVRYSTYCSRWYQYYYEAEEGGVAAWFRARDVPQRIDNLLKLHDQWYYDVFPHRKNEAPQQSGD